MVRSVKFTEKIPVSSHLIEVRDRMVMVGIVVALFFGVDVICSVLLQYHVQLQIL